MEERTDARDNSLSAILWTSTSVEYKLTMVNHQNHTGLSTWLCHSIFCSIGQSYYVYHKTTRDEFHYRLFRGIRLKTVNHDMEISYMKRKPGMISSIEQWHRVPIIDNWMAWQWAETLVEIRGILADIRVTTKWGIRYHFPKHEFSRSVCLVAHHYLLAHLSQ